MRLLQIRKARHKQAQALAVGETRLSIMAIRMNNIRHQRIIFIHFTVKDFLFAITIILFAKNDHVSSNIVQ